LIWGDNKLVTGSLLAEYAGKVDLIYIDPPFATGDDFSMKIEIGDQEVVKQPSIIEEHAYRDTWGAGRDSWFTMMYERLVLLRDLLAETGTIYVHLDWYVGHHLRPVLDEVFGENNSLGEIIWAYGSPSGGRAAGKKLVKAHDLIYVFAREAGKQKYQPVYLPYSEKYIKDWFRWEDEDGRRYRQRQRRDKETGETYWERQYLDESKGVPASTVWSDIQQVYADPRAYKKGMRSEITGYPTQKPERLIERIIELSTEPGDLVADFFCGSGTTPAVAEKLGRRWIATDLGRFGIHTTRKRLLNITDCKPFEIKNLGAYERQRWQRESGNGRLTDYLDTILSFYKAEPVEGFTNLHGQKAGRMIHVGATDAPVTIDELEEVMDEMADNGIESCDVLGWEWEMGLHDTISETARRRGLDLRPLQIPREIIEPGVRDADAVRFFELAHVDLDVKRSKREVSVVLKDFAIPSEELIPSQVRDRIESWSDLIDYWSVDFDYTDDTFHNQWQAYRTREEPKLTRESGPHEYEEAGRHMIVVKIIDIFGNDTTKLAEVAVK
jgi:DNA modification methylase